MLSDGIKQAATCMETPVNKEPILALSAIAMTQRLRRRPPLAQP
jgi:hypothetical protein